MLRGVIAQIDAFIQSHEEVINPTDSRVLAVWKLGAEKLRCQILDVTIPYGVSDTIVTPIQVFFLKFGTLRRHFEQGKNAGFIPRSYSKTVDCQRISK